jgi:hypothetical protein
MNAINALMHSHNANNLAVYVGHLYMHVNEFRTSDMFRSVCIDPPLRIVTH